MNTFPPIRIVTLFLAAILKPRKLIEQKRLHWLKAIESKVGTEHEVEPMPPAQWLQQDPIAEAVEMFGEEKVVVVRT